jgi:uncharacterized membrane protein YGL010W
MVALPLASQPMASLFRPAADLLARYAEYHRDRRNIITHLVGIPLIVWAVSVLLARVMFDVAGVGVTLAWVAWALASLWYVTRGEFGLGLTTSLAIGALVTLAHPAAAAGLSAWLALGLGGFLLGWMFQFLGHYYEGRKPAFVDDLAGLLVGPMFVMLELLAMLGLFHALIGEIERRVGPTLLRDLAHPAA